MNDEEKVRFLRLMSRLALSPGQAAEVEELINDVANRNWQAGRDEERR